MPSQVFLFRYALLHPGQMYTFVSLLSCAFITFPSPSQGFLLALTRRIQLCHDVTAPFLHFVRPTFEDPRPHQAAPQPTITDRTVLSEKADEAGAEDNDEEMQVIRDAEGYNRVAELLKKEIGLEGEDKMGKIARYPQLLSCTDSLLRQKIQFFREPPLEFSNDEIQKCILTYPRVLIRAVDGLKLKTMFLLEQLGGDKLLLRHIVLHSSAAVAGSLEANLKPRMAYLKNDLFSGDTDALYMALRKYQRSLLMSSVDSRIRPCVDALRERGIDPTKNLTWLTMRKDRFNAWIGAEVFARGDQKARRVSMKERAALLQDAVGLNIPVVHELLHYNPATIKRRITFLEELLGFSGNETKRIVRRCQQILAKDEIGLKQNLAFLVEFYDGDREYLLSIAKKCPRVLIGSLENKNYTLNSLVDFFGGDKEIVKSIISKSPILSTCSWKKNIEPKINYLRQALDINDVTLRQSVSTRPDVLLYSLEKRIKPRIEAMVSNGIDPTPVLLDVVIYKNKENFIAWLAKQSLLEPK